MARLCRLLGVALVASVASLRRLEGECVDDPKWFYSGKSVKDCAYVLYGFCSRLRERGSYFDSLAYWSIGFGLRRVDLMFWCERWIDGSSSL